MWFGNFVVGCRFSPLFWVLWLWVCTGFSVRPASGVVFVGWVWLVCCCYDLVFLEGLFCVWLWYCGFVVWFVILGFVFCVGSLVWLIWWDFWFPGIVLRVGWAI